MGNKWIRTALALAIAGAPLGQAQPQQSGSFFRVPLQGVNALPSQAPNEPAPLTASNYGAATVLPGQAISLPAPPVTGGTAPYAFSASLPAGLTLAGNGAITGQIATPGTYAGTVSVTDSSTPQRTAPAGYSVTVSQPPAPGAVAVSLPNLQGTAETNAQIAGATLSATGGKAPYAFSASGLPAGVTLNAATGALSGAPTAAGTYSIGFTVTESFASRTASLGPYTLVVSDPAPQELAITTTPALPSEAMVGRAIAPVTLQHTGGTGAVSYFTQGSAPAGIDVAGTTLSGTPEPGSEGSYSFQISATDSGSPTQFASVPVPITVYGAFQAAPSATPQATATIGVPIAPVTVNAQGGKPPYLFGRTGTLPSGVSIDQNTGVLSGTPQQMGTFSYKLTATHSFNGAVTLETAQYTLQVNDTPALSFAPQTPPANATVGTAIGPLAMNPTGGLGPYSYTLVGTAPPELAFSGNQLNGTPSANGDYSFQIRIADSTPGTPKVQTSGTYTMAVRGPVGVTTSALNLATATVPYSMQMAAHGGNGTYTYAATGLPSPLTMSASSLISGTPTSPGTFPIQVTATDGAGRQSPAAALSLSIQGAPVATVPRPTTVSSAVVAAGQGNWAGTANSSDVFYDASATTGVNAFAGYEGGGMPRQNSLMTWSTAHKGNCAIVGVNNRGANFTMMVRFRMSGVSKSQVTLSYPSGLSTQTFVSTAAAGTDINEVELLVGSVHTNYIAHTFKPGAWDGTTCQPAS